MTKRLAQIFDELRSAHTPKDLTDEEEVKQQFEKLYDAIVPVMAEYRTNLEDDDPLKTYLDYFLRSELDILNDEEDEPELYATIPPLVEGEEPITSMASKFKEELPSYSTVRITFCSPLGDVGITRDLKSSRGFETRVFWDSLTRYRSKP